MFQIKVKLLIKYLNFCVELVKRMDRYVHIYLSLTAGREPEAGAEAEIKIHQTSTLCNENSPYLFIFEVISCDFKPLCDQSSTAGILGAVDDAHKDGLVSLVEVVVLQEPQYIHTCARATYACMDIVTNTYKIYIHV